MTITAPFRFARINRKVYFPDWASRVSHDVPFEDGLSGTIALTITTRTPLLVGGKRKKENGPDNPATVYPFKDGSGKWAIPGSSIQGVIRQMLEVAAFGKLGPVVHDRRFGVRDLTGKITGREIYASRLTEGNGAVLAIRSKVKTGWLIRSQDGRVAIVDCKSARVSFEQIAMATKGDAQIHNLMARTGEFEALLNATEERLPDNEKRKIKNRRLKWSDEISKDAPQRYAAVLSGRDLTVGLAISIRPGQERPEAHSPGNIIYRRCTLSKHGEEGAVEATLVLTGKPSVGDQAGKKHLEFAFYGPDRLAATIEQAKFEVPQSVWRDFLLIHDPEKGSGGSINPNWDFWKQEFLNERPVPVFYIEEAGKVSALGMAQMFKLAMTLSTHDMLKHSSTDHTDREKFDLPSLIFGGTGGDGQKDSWFSYNLKRRATFDLFRADDPGTGGERPDNWQVLLNPKPSYYPIYVRQNGRPRRERPYAAYHSMAGQNDDALESPELAGTKLWPVRGEPQPQANEAKQGEIRKVANHLRSVPAGQRFNGAMRVHNLRPAELGALLWVLTFGGQGGTHRLGGAKPLGFGEVKIEIAAVELFANYGAVPDQATLIAAFVKEMNMFHGDTWEQSPQVQALLKAASTGTQGLAYLNGHKGYADARRENQIMDGYADSDAELPRDLVELRKVAAEANRKRDEAEKQAKNEILAARPHLAYAPLVDAKFPNRQSPPDTFAGYPPTDAFALGDSVMLSGNVEGIIVAYPAMRSHPSEINRTKWGVGYVNAGGTMIVEERKQADIAKAK